MVLHVELVSPERQMFEGEAELVIARTTDGEIGFETGHVPFVGILLPNVVRVQSSGEETRIAVHSGFIELANDHLTLLSDVAEIAADIDVGRAQAALARADDALSADGDDDEAAAARVRALVRLDAAGASA